MTQIVTHGTTTTSLLPLPLGSGMIGTWTGKYFSPTENSYWVAYEGDLGISGDLWNTSPNSSGGVTVSWDSTDGALTYDVNFSSASASNSAYGNILGYPNVLYGLSPWGGKDTSVSAFKLPEQVSQIAQQSVQIYAGYSIQNPNSVPLDFIYDTFLTTDSATTSSGGPTALGSSIELVMWLDSQNGIAPAGSAVANLTIPTSINGQLESAGWTVHVTPGGQPGVPLVVFQLNNSPNPSSGASVGVYLSTLLDDLVGNSAIISAINSVAGQNWTQSSLLASYLDGIFLGSEFYGGASSTNYSWTLNSYNISSTPNPPPAATTAVMIMNQDASGNYEIYDIGNNAVLAAFPLMHAGSPWKSVDAGGFEGSDTSDVLLRNSSTGAFELFDVAGNNASNPVQLGAVGTDWSVLGFGDFSGNAGETDMLMRQSGTAKLEVYDISNNQITNAASMGAVGPEWNFLGVGDFSSNANETDLLMRDSNNGALEVYNVSHNAIVSASGMGAIGVEWSFVGVGDFSGNAGETDMLMRDTNNGALEVYNVHNDQIVGAQAMGAVGLEWSVVGIGDFSGNPGETDMITRNANTGAFEIYDISHDSIVSASSIGAVGTDWQTVGIAPFQSAGATVASLGNSRLSSGGTTALQGGFDPSTGGIATTGLPGLTPLADSLIGQFGGGAPAAEVTAPTSAGSTATQTLAGSLFHSA